MCGQDEGVRNAAADDERIDLRAERFEHRELGGDFRPADDGDQRPRRMRERLAERIELGGQQRSRAGDACVLAMPCVVASARWAVPNASLT